MAQTEEVVQLTEAAQPTEVASHPEASAIANLPQPTLAMPP